MLKQKVNPRGRHGKETSLPAHASPGHTDFAGAGCRVGGVRALASGAGERHTGNAAAGDAGRMSGGRQHPRAGAGLSTHAAASSMADSAGDCGTGLDAWDGVVHPGGTNHSEGCNLTAGPEDHGRLWWSLRLREKALLAALLGNCLMYFALTSEVIPSELYFIGLLLPSAVVFMNGFIHLWHRRWNPGVVNVTFLPLFILIVFFVFSNVLIVAIAGSKSDNFAVGLELPTDIPLYQPLQFPSYGHFTDFDLIEEGQPGKYMAVILIEPPTSGNVHLKAYEITRNVQLSVSRMNHDTRQYFPMIPHAERGRRYETSFTIFEGDWGQPYAARCEVWLTPDDRRPPIKLREKNFVIEGWMR